MVSNNSRAVEQNGAPPLPANIEAEECVIASLLLDPTVFAEVAQHVRPGDFHDPHCRAAARVVFDLAEAGDPIDPFIVSQNLRSVAPFAGGAVSPATFLAEAGRKTPTAAHAGYYARLVKEAADKRRLHAAAMSAAAASLNGHTANEIRELLLHAVEAIDDRSAPQNGSIELFNSWAQGVRDRESPASFVAAPAWSDLSKFPLVAQRIAVVGAPPGAGKTALVNQLIFEALRAEGQETLRALILNVEMPPGDLLDRQLARIARVGYWHLSARTFSEDARPRIEAGISELQSIMPRVEFMAPPFTLERLRHRCDSFDPQIVVVDYVQRIDFADRSTDARAQATAAMSVLRGIADQERAVVAISAVARQRGSGGSSYETKSLGLASFRESSELEYGADSAWIMHRDENDGDQVEVRCVKNRHGSLASLRLKFNGANMEFVDDTPPEKWDFNE